MNAVVRLALRAGEWLLLMVAAAALCAGSAFAVAAEAAGSRSASTVADNSKSDDGSANGNGNSVNTAGSGSGNSTGAAARGTPREVQLRMSWWGGNEVHRAYLASIRRFEAKYPHIKVKGEYTGWVGHLERLTTQIAGGTAPDVMQVNWNWLVLFSRDGKGFYDLNSLNGTVDLTQFDAEARSTGTVRGKLNALPVTMTARVFYFNATTFAKAGLPVPRSWDELFAAGPIFRERLGEDYYPLALNFLDVLALCRSWVVQRTNAPLVNEDSRRLNATEADTAEMACVLRPPGP